MVNEEGLKLGRLLYFIRTRCSICGNKNRIVCYYTWYRISKCGGCSDIDITEGYNGGLDSK